MDISESAVLQGMEAGKRLTNMRAIIDDTDEIDGMEKQFVTQLFAVEMQRAYVDELKDALKKSIEDLNAEDLQGLKKTLSSQVSTLVLMEVRFKSLETTVGDIQNRLKAIETAGTTPAAS